MSAAKPLLDVSGLTRRFGGLVAVSDVTFQVSAGEIAGLIGPNGAGKTTLFNMLAGSMTPSGGRIRFNGADCTGLPAQHMARLGVARTFQITSLFPRLTVLDNVLLAIKGVRSSKFVAWRFMSSYRDVYEKADKLLEQAAFLDRRDTEVRHLSHGEQRQLEIVLGLASNPKILLLD